MLDLASPLDGFGSPFGVRRNGFTEMTPFLNGALGLLYKPRPAVLKQDAAGTTDVAAAADPVGLQLDDSKQLAETLAYTTDFSTSTGWTTLTNATVSGGTLNLSPSATAAQTAPVGYVVGALYRVTYTITDINPGSGSLRCYVGSTGQGQARTTIGTFTEYIFAAGASAIYFFTGASFVSGSIDDLTVTRIAGSHAVLSGANTLRPLYQVTPQRLVFDGSDDRLLTTLNPTASGTIAMRLRGTTASRVAFGSQGASNGRAFLALASDGSLAAGIGADSTTTIKGSSDIRNAWATGIVTWDGSTVKLYQDGTQVYSGAQNGAVNTTVPWMFGCLNNNATAASFWGGDIGAAEVLDRAMTPAEVTSLTTLWSTIQ